MSEEDSRWEERLLESFKQGEPSAAHQLWSIYRARLEALVRHRLGISRLRVIEDEEDVALSTFHCMIVGATSGRFNAFRNLNDLWRLLAAIARRKAQTHKAQARRLKRGGNASQDVQTAGINHTQSLPDRGEYGRIDREMSPSDQAALADLRQYLLDQLRDDTLRKVAELRLDGHSNGEIAAILSCSERTVERKLERIRWIWIQCGILSIPGQGERASDLPAE